MENLYEVLEVAQTATKKEIKKSYYKLAKKYHPDHNQGDAKAAERFKAVGEAYRILSDDNARAEYDQKLAQGPAAAAGPGRGPAPQQQKQQQRAQRPQAPTGQNLDFDNVSNAFSTFFGFDPKSKNITDERQINTYTKKEKKVNPLDAAGMFEQFLGLGNKRR